MVKNSYIPDRGDIVYLDFSPTKGHEQSGHRPAFVLSPKNYNNKTGLAIVVPITNKTKGYFFEVQMLGKNITGVILADQLKTIDYKIRKIKFIEKSNIAVLKEVIEKINLLVN